MQRKRITEIFPVLLPLRVRQRKFCYFLNLVLDKNNYARDLSKMPLSYMVYSYGSPMINENSGYDIKYQYNKVHNLKLAARSINGLLIRPGETFSYFLATRNADKKETYLDGLSLVNGEITGAYGGGLCQLSNLLYWLFLHSPLTVMERHGHGIESIPAIDSDFPTGVDATVSEGWLDLKVKNETAHTFQLAFDFDGDNMIGHLLCSEPSTFNYEIFNGDINYMKKDGKIIEHSTVIRKKTSIQTGVSEDELLYENNCEISYPLPEGTEIKEGDL